MLLHPSPLTVFPSSHPSYVTFKLSPQIGSQFYKLSNIYPVIHSQVYEVVILKCNEVLQDIHWTEPPYYKALMHPVTFVQTPVTK